MQLRDCPDMIDRPRHIDTAPEREAEAIPQASDQEVRHYVRRGIYGTVAVRWVVHCLNWPEGRAATRDLARQPLAQAGISNGRMTVIRPSRMRPNLFRTLFACGRRPWVSTISQSYAQAR
jgi:hypothetical protein